MSEKKDKLLRCYTERRERLISNLLNPECVSAQCVWQSDGRLPSCVEKAYQVVVSAKLTQLYLWGNDQLKFFPAIR